MIQENKTISVLDTKIKDCDFTMRLQNVLVANGVRYIKQVIVLSEKQILSFNFLGRSSFNELRDFLNKNGLKLIGDIDKEPEPEVKPVEVKQDILDIKIKDCGFTTRAQNCLVCENIMYVKELILFTEIQLLRLHNLGRKSLNQIKYFLGQHDLALTSNHIGLLREQTKHGMQLRLAIDDKTSKQVIKLWIELNTPLLAEGDNEMMKAKCFLENINRR